MRAAHGDTIAGGRVLHTWNDLLGNFPGRDRRQDRPHGRRRLVRGRGGAQAAVTIYATILGSPSRAQRNADLAALLRWGLSRYRVAAVIVPRPHVPRAPAPATAARRSRLVARGVAARSAPTARSWRVVVARRGSRCPSSGANDRAGRASCDRAVLGERPRSSRRSVTTAWSVDFRANRKAGARGSAARRAAPRSVRATTNAPCVIFRPATRQCRRKDHVLIVTVTLNAALDRTLTVPNFQLGHRHRASAGLTLAGGKGINVARALKALDVPVVATGLAGGRTGTRIVEELTAEAILNDFVRIGDESRTSTMVVDPTDGSSTEIYEWGPQVSRDELDMLLEKIAYLARAADLVVFAGAARARVDRRVLRGGDSRADAPPGVRAVLDTEGEPLRLGVEAEPWLVSPNQREAEGLVGQEFHDEEDFLMALDAIAELGARNVLIAPTPAHSRSCASAPCSGFMRSCALCRRSLRSARATHCSRAISLRALAEQPVEAALRHGGRHRGRVDARARRRAASTRDEVTRLAGEVAVTAIQPRRRGIAAARPSAFRGTIQHGRRADPRQLSGSSRWSSSPRKA